MNAPPKRPKQPKTGFAFPSRDDSFGHRLIAELIEHLEYGMPLSDEARKHWLGALKGMFHAKNFDDVLLELTDCLGLEFKTGRRHGEIELTVFRIKCLEIHEGMTVLAASKELAKTAPRGTKTIGDTYYEYCNQFPTDANIIQRIAEITEPEKVVEVDLESLRLWICNYRKNPHLLP